MNSVPPSATSNKPGLVATAPVKAPFSWPNSSLSSNDLGQRGTVDRDDRLVGPGAGAVQGLGDQFLAGAAFALDQDCLVGAAGAFDEAEDLLHGGDFADDFRLGLPAAEDFLELHVFLAKLAALVCFLDEDFQLGQAGTAW